MFAAKAKLKPNLSVSAQKDPAEMSSWERRKMYWKNMYPATAAKNPIKTNETVVEAKESNSARSLSITSITKIVPDLPPQPKAKVTTAKSNVNATASRFLEKGKPTKVAGPSRKVPFVPVGATSRRATIANVTSRPSIVPNRRLTVVVSSKPVAKTSAKLPAPIIPKTEITTEVKKGRKRYHEVPSRICTGIKKIHLQNSVSSSAPCKVFTKPTDSSKVTKPTVKARRSLHIAPKSFIQADPVGKLQKTLLPEAANSTNTLHPLRRKTLISNKGEEKEAQKRKAVPARNEEAKKCKPSTDKLVACASRVTRSSKTSLMKTKEPLKSICKCDVSVVLVKYNEINVLANKNIETEKCLSKQCSIGTSSTSGKKDAELEQCDDDEANTTFEILDDIVPPEALNRNFENLGNTPRPIRRGSFTISKDNLEKDVKKSTNIALSTLQISTPNNRNLNKSTSKPVISGKKLFNKSGNKTKTPTKSALKKNPKFFSSFNITDSAEFEDVENLPPTGEALDSGPTPKRSKSVSFMVSTSDKKTPKTLPKTPKRDLSLRQKLENFIEEKGCSASMHRHIQCFGYQLSDLKRGGAPRLSNATASTPKLASPSLKDRMPVKKRPQSLSSTASSSKSPEENIDSILSDLRTLLIMGQPVEQGEEWLSALETHVPEKLQDNARFWVVKALLAERAGRFQDAWHIFSQAVDRDVQPHEELTSALNEFASRVPPAQGREISAVSDQESSLTEKALDFEEGSLNSSFKRRGKNGRSSGRANRRKKSQAKDQEIFESTFIKYTMQRSNALQSLNKILNLGTPSVAAVLTPVRRSARLTRSAAKNRRSYNMEDLPEQIRKTVLSTPRDFL